MERFEEGFAIVAQAPANSISPLLTLAIPTYNREGDLRTLLSVLFSQVVAAPLVELIVSDNASSDNTSSVVTEYQQKGLIIRYIRNEVNIGADANFLQCYEAARGEYVWMIGDDDVVVPGGLKFILNLLAERKYDLIYVSSYGFRDKYTPSKKEVITAHVIEPQGAIEYALQVNVFFTFISGNIFRKKKIEEWPHRDFRTFVGTLLIQTSWIFTLLDNDPRCAIITNRLVASKVENTGGYGTAQVFGRNFSALIDQFFGLDSRMGRAILNPTLQVWFPWAVIHARSGRSKNHLQEDLRRVLTNLFHKNFRFWFFLWPVILLPIPFAKAWHVMGKVVQRLDKALRYPIAR